MVVIWSQILGKKYLWVNNYKLEMYMVGWFIKKACILTAWLTINSKVIQWPRYYSQARKMWDYKQKLNRPRVYWKVWPSVSRACDSESLSIKKIEQKWRIFFSWISIKRCWFCSIKISKNQSKNLRIWIIKSPLTTFWFNLLIF